MNNLIWKDLPGFVGRYRVSENGGVLSIFRYISKLLKPFLSHKGYLSVHLSLNGRARWESIHRLVAQAFLENNNGLPEVNHKDGNKLNNHYFNLEWISTKDHLVHTRVLKLFNRGLKAEKNRSVSLDWRKVKHIRNTYIKGEITLSDLAKRFGIGISTVSRVVKNICWIDNTYVSPLSVSKRTHKLYICEIKEIKRLYSTNLFSKESLSQMFNINTKLVRSILNGGICFGKDYYIHASE